METEAADDIRQIRADLDMLTKLYSKLVDRLVPEEEPEPKDVEAIESTDELKGEDELFKALDR